MTSAADRYATTLLSAFSQALRRACDAEAALEQAQARIAELESAPKPPRKGR